VANGGGGLEKSASADRGHRSPLRDYAVVLYGFILSRLALLEVGLLTESNIKPVTTFVKDQTFSSAKILNIWGAWDTGWYIDLAVHGYQSVAKANGQANWAFFPAYPALANAISQLTGLTAFEAMLAISNVSFLAALVVVHRLARAEFDKKTADLAVVLLCVVPESYIFSAAYTESLFLLCLSGALLLIRREKWLAAGAVAAMAVLTRNLGVALLLPYAWAAIERVVFDRNRVAKLAPRASELVRIGLGGILPVLAVAAFMLYLQSRTGDALAFVHVQKAWGRSFGNPFAAPLAGLLHPDTLQSADLVSFVMAWVAIGLLVKLVFMRRPRLLVLAVFLTLVPLTGGLASFARYTLVIVPLWLVLAHHLAARPRGALAVVAIFAMLNGFMMVAWTLALKVTM